MKGEHTLSKADEIMMGWFEAMGESPRGFVICCVAMIDDELGRMIRHEMEQKEQALRKSNPKDEVRSGVIEAIFDPVKGGSLQTIHAKRQLAYAMGWIDNDMYHDIGVLARIRNLFAHVRISPTFDDAPVHKLVLKLKFPLWFYEKEDLHELSRRDRGMIAFHVDSEVQVDTKNEPFAKTLFFASVHMIVSNFQDGHADEVGAEVQ